MVTMATNTITLTTGEFALLYEFLDREHSTSYGGVESIDLTTKIGVKLWRRVQEIATKQGFVPRHAPIDSGLCDMPCYQDETDE
jgi:hypothetical protein